MVYIFIYRIVIIRPIIVPSVISSYAAPKTPMDRSQILPFRSPSSQQNFHFLSSRERAVEERELEIQQKLAKLRLLSEASRRRDSEIEKRVEERIAQKMR